MRLFIVVLFYFVGLRDFPIIEIHRIFTWEHFYQIHSDVGLFFTKDLTVVTKTKLRLKRNKKMYLSSSSHN